MRGGMRMPPNLLPPAVRHRSLRRFNEGRHAHAAECPPAARSCRSPRRFNEGRHAHAAE